MEEQFQRPPDELRFTKKEQIQLKKQAKEEQRAAVDRAGKRKKLITVGTILFAIAVAVFLLSKYGGSSGGGNTYADPSVGSKDATVVLTSYEDFQCPACAAAAPMIKDIIAEFGDKIRYEYNDFPLSQHQYGTTAAIAAECALEQGKFFELHDVLYDRQDEWAKLASTDVVEQQIRTYGEEVGLDVAAFDLCVVRQDIADHVNEDIVEARSLRVNSTPSFFVNGKRVVGLPISTALRDAITNALQ